MDDYAMQYEYLIRRAHSCGRRGVSGADADIYRRFTRNANHYFTNKKNIEKGLPSTRTNSLDELYGKYMRELGEVSANLKSAIRHVYKNYESKLTSTQFDDLQKCSSNLSSDDLSLDSLKGIIDEADKIMLEIGLYPG